MSPRPDRDRTPAGPPPARPADLLRTSAEQMRQAGDLLAEIARETAPGTPGHGAGTAARVTVREAQRSFDAALRLAQFEESPDGD
jgi:hypothetical protein